MSLFFFFFVWATALVKARLSDSAFAGIQNSQDSIVIRAAANAPDGYSPKGSDCPSQRPEVRAGSSLSQQELEWLPKRRLETIQPMKEFLKRASIPDFDIEKYFSNIGANSTALPNIGIAASGGGYRAMLNGAGAISAFDSRSPNAREKGNLGGLLQSATYLSGLSGGGWLVGSIYANNFTTVHDAVMSKGIWQFGNSILEGPEDIGLLRYYTDIILDVNAKRDAGFNRSITDYWGRMLSYQLVNAENGGPAVTFSSIADDEAFQSGKMPLPLLVADSRDPGEKNTTIENALFEFNPWEMGSFDPSISGFIPLKYAGTEFDSGKIVNNEQCVRGFDNIGFVMGTSSSLFNQIVLRLKNNADKYVPKDIPKELVESLIEFLTALGEAKDDIADWKPNPFKGWHKKTNKFADGDRLTLVDGGEDGQNIPFHPHTVIDRKVDVVFAVDSSSDVHNWPNGAAPMATYERSLSSVSNGTSFPAIPGKDTFVNLKLNTKPTFFGCDLKNTTTPAPLVVYLPNYPYVFWSNTSTFEMTYNDSTRNAMIANGWAVVTQNNSTRDADWPSCVGCAILHRSFERTNTTVPARCDSCFQKYCWNGTLDEAAAADYQPTPLATVIDTQQSAAPLLGGINIVLMIATCASAAIFLSY